MSTNLIKNKKGQLLGTGPALIVTTIIVVLVMIAMVLLVNLLAKPSEAVPAKISLTPSISTSLMAYLETPVVVIVGGKEEEMSMADLIMLAEMNISYGRFVDRETRNIFDPVYGESWGIDASKVYSFRTAESRQVSPTEVVTVSKDYKVSRSFTLPSGGTVTLYLN